MNSKFFKKEKGQSLIEILFSITVVTLVLTGVVSLMVKVLNVRGEASLRQKAGNLSTIIIENQIKEKDNNPDTFWNTTLLPPPDQIMVGFDGFTYDVGKTSIGQDLNMVVTVKWADQTLTVQRYFSKKGS